MASKVTHIFKTVDTLELKLDIYTRSSISPNFKYNPNVPIVLFLHGGGFVAFDREHIPPHIVQSCLLRNWPLVSADYRKLPQTKGPEILEDVKAAYEFVVPQVPGILGGSGKCETVVVVGQSAGAYLSLLYAHCMIPRPIAVLAYYSIATVSDPYFTSSKVLGPKPMTKSQIQKFIDEPAGYGSTPAVRSFNPKCLSSDLSQNLEYQKPSEEEGKQLLARLGLVPWFLQETLFPELLGSIDRSLEDHGWKNFPETVLLAGVIGPTPAKLFTAEGQPHGFNGPLFLGDPAPAVVEEAWIALDKIVKSKTQG